MRKHLKKTVKGENIPEPGVPESFKVLLKELQSIGLDVKILNEDQEEVVIKELDDDDNVSENEDTIKEVMGEEASQPSEMVDETTAIIEQEEPVTAGADDDVISQLGISSFTSVESSQDDED